MQFLLAVGVCPYVWVEPISTWRGQAGEKVEFHCKAIGEPTPRIYWVRADGRPLDYNARVSNKPVSQVRKESFWI